MQDRSGRARPDTGVTPHRIAGVVPSDHLRIAGRACKG
ncbi:hypothetical protein A7982_13558 [Minicystis rosea]|nr:hypothetical protein A7982_13558 [Minicystis rosea]